MIYITCAGNWVCQNKTSVISGEVEGVVMSIPLLYVLRGYHLFHYGEAKAASFRFWDSCKGHADAHA
jgi:hypothetical protein